MRVSAIVLAAGIGERFIARTPKLFVSLGSKPVIWYSLIVLSRQSDINDIIVVANARTRKALEDLIQRYRIRKINTIVLGGRRRQDSVYNGLQAVPVQSDLILIHDGARPFISSEMVSAVIRQARKTGAAVAGVPVKATIKEIRLTSEQVNKLTGAPIVRKTLDRKRLWEIQTPQVFKKGLIVKAFKRNGKALATDDAMLVERSGYPVSVVPGSYANIKITTVEDLLFAKAIVKFKIQSTKFKKSGRSYGNQSRYRV